MKKIISFLKNIFVGAVILYTYNMISVSYDMIIPINVYTVGYMGVFGLPALFSIILIQRLVY